MVEFVLGAVFVVFYVFLYIKSRQKNVDNDQYYQDNDFKLQKNDNDAGAYVRLTSDDHILIDDCMSSAVDHSRNDFYCDLSNEYQQNMFGMGRDLE